MTNVHRIGTPDGAIPLESDLSDLPPPDTQRWVARRKAQVVAAVQAGRLPLEEALRLYRLTLEEFASWQRALLRHGMSGLKASRLHVAEARERLGRTRSGWGRGTGQRRAHG